MTSIGRFLTLGAAVLLASCGGSGSGSAPVAGNGGGATTTDTLTIKYPTNFHIARIATGTTAQQSRRRSPAYINPSPGPYSGEIDIFVDGTKVITATPNPNASSDGTQSFAIPLFAQATQGVHQIVAVETESGLNSAILAIGETDQSTDLTGGTTSLSLTMQQNVQYIGLMSSATDNANDAEAYDSPSTSNPPVYSSQQECVSQSGDSFTVYPFAADATGGFQANNSNTGYGAGGSFTPGLTGFTLTQPYADLSNFDTITGPTYGNTGYTITFQGNGSITPSSYYGIQLHFSVQNPVAAIYQDAITYDSEPGFGAYPGIEKLYAAGTLPLNTLSTTNPFVTTIEVDPFYGGECG